MKDFHFQHKVLLFDSSKVISKIETMKKIVSVFLIMYVIQTAFSYVVVCKCNSARYANPHTDSAITILFMRVPCPRAF